MTPARFVLVLLTVPAPAMAQTTLFEDDFEQPIAARWTVSGQFHRADSSDPCLIPVTPFPSGDHVMWYGNQALCDFSHGLVGSLQMVHRVHLPAAAMDARVTFWSYESAEFFPMYDMRLTEVSADLGATWTLLGQGFGPLDEWHQQSYDLTPWLGRAVLIRFRFDAVDDINNYQLGWLIDDVKIVADTCTPSTFCVTSPNSVGSGALIGATLTGPFLTTLTLTSAPPGKFGLFFYGPTEVSPLPLADGFLCIGSGATGLTRLHLFLIDGSGNASTDLLHVPDGTTWYTQAWYRDPAGPGIHGSNLSDGVRITFCH